TFQIDSPGRGIADFVASPSGLYFLLLGRDDAELVNTTFRGETLTRTPLALDGGFRPVQLVVDRAGNTVVHERSRTSSRLTVIDRVTRVQSRRTLSRWLEEVASMDTGLIGFDQENAALVHLPEFTSFMNLTAVDEPSKLLSLGQGRLAIIELGIPRV